MDGDLMKKLILMLLALPSLAMADGRDIVLTQRNANDDANILRVLPSPVTDGLIYYNATTLLPGYVTLGTGLSISSGVLNASAGASQVQTDWNASSGLAKILNRPTLSTVAMTGQYGDLSGTPTIPAAQVASDWNAVSGVAAILNKPTLFNGAYSSLTSIPSTFAPSAHTQAFSTITSTPTTLSGYGIADAYPLSGNPSAFVNQAGARTAVSLTTTGSGAATYSSSTGVLNVPTPSSASTPTQSSANRSLNTAFQISTTRNTLVSYSVQLIVTASIAGGQNGDVILEIASDSGFTANVQTVAITGLGQTYTLAVALQGVQPQTGVVSGFVPAGYYTRLRTVNNTGTPTYSVRAGQEILL